MVPRMTDTAPAHLRVDRRDDGVAVLTLDNPDQRNAMSDAMTASWVAAVDELAGDRDLPSNIGLMAAGAVSGLIFDELLTGRAERLPELLPDLLFALLVPYIGPSAATEEMRRAATG